MHVQNAEGGTESEANAHGMTKFIHTKAAWQVARSGPVV